MLEFGATRVDRPTTIPPLSTCLSLGTGNDDGGAGVSPFRSSSFSWSSGITSPLALYFNCDWVLILICMACLLSFRLACNKMRSGRRRPDWRKKGEKPKRRLDWRKRSKMLKRRLSDSNNCCRRKSCKSSKSKKDGGGNKKKAKKGHE